MPLIFPSIMCADPLAIGASLQTLNPYADGYHIDIMDGHFVPNIVGSGALISAIAHATVHPLWIHYMTQEPLVWLTRFPLPKASIVSFHIEIASPIEPIVTHLKDHGAQVSIAISPGTAVDRLFPFLSTIDEVLVMGVNPGHSGQHFVSSVIDTIIMLKNLQMMHGYTFRLSMDGGIGPHNIDLLAQLGISHFVVGSALFNSSCPADTLRTLKKK